MEGVDKEIDSLRNEYRWILKEEAKSVLQELKAVLTEACSRFPVNIFPGEDQIIKPEKYVFSSPTGTQQIKCMLTLLAETICEADITFKLSKQQSPYTTKITPDAPWRLTQIQDAGNHLFLALKLVDDSDETDFKTGQEIQHLMKSLTESLNRGRSCLAMPKRKTIEDLLQNSHMRSLKPGLPKDVVASFYVQAQKIILCLYKLNLNAQRVDITSRHQVECSVPWLNDILVFFTLALQLCQQLQDKLAVFMQYEAELETTLLPSKASTTIDKDGDQTLINFSPTESKTNDCSGDNLLTAAMDGLTMKEDISVTVKHSTSKPPVQKINQDTLIDFS